MSAYLLDQAVRGLWPSATQGTGQMRVVKVYLRMAALAQDETDLCWCSQNSLAADLNMARRDVQNAQRQLEKERYIERAGRHVPGQRGTVFRVLVRESCAYDDQKPAVLQADVNCSCPRCSELSSSSQPVTEKVTEMADGDGGGEVSGTRDRETKKNEPPSPASQSDGFHDQDVLHIAREAITEAAREEISNGYTGEDYADIRRRLDDEFFWPLVSRLRELSPGLRRSSEIHAYAHHLVQRLAAQRFE